MSKKDDLLLMNSRRKYVLNEKTQFVIKEAYKTARTNLVFSLAPFERKIVVVTSCSPSEGKSTTCVNLAITMAETGVKVLLIDADMRKPTIHTTLKQKNHIGLSSILGGICSDVKLALHSDIRPNLDVITSGPIPPNPAELLSSAKMRKLLTLLCEYYDYIFIDTPPVNVVSDSQLMNDIIAGLIFVVKEDSTTHPSIKVALQSVELAQGKVLGFMKVACNAKGSKSYKSYKYGHYGRYGHYGKNGSFSTSDLIKSVQKDDGNLRISSKEKKN